MDILQKEKLSPVETIRRILRRVVASDQCQFPKSVRRMKAPSLRLRLERESRIPIRLENLCLQPGESYKRFQLKQP
jgi:hypothetical protein